MLKLFDKILRIIVILFLAIPVIFFFYVMFITRPRPPIGEAIPWGVWESSDPPFRLFIKPELRLWEYPDLLDGDMEWERYMFPALYRGGEKEETALASFFLHAFEHNIEIVGVDLDGEMFFRFSGFRFRVVNGILRILRFDRREVLFFPVLNYYPTIDIDAGWLGYYFRTE